MNNKAKRAFLSGLKAALLVAAAAAYAQYEATGKADLKVAAIAVVAWIIKGGWKALDVQVETKKKRLGN